MLYTKLKDRIVPVLQRRPSLIHLPVWAGAVALAVAALLAAGWLMYWLAPSRPVPQQGEPTAVAAPAVPPQEFVSIKPAKPAEPEVQSGPVRFVLPRGRIASPFGWQVHPVYQEWRYHSGVDVAVAANQAVVSAADGTVTAVQRDANYGLTVVVENARYSVQHAALSSSAVKIGDAVTAGETVIGRSGQSVSEPYPHVHIAVRQGGKYCDPQAIEAAEPQR